MIVAYMCKVKTVSSITIFYANIIDIDECVADSPCSTNAECTNTEGSFMCECNTGFDGDGYNCTGMFYIIVHELLATTCMF